MPVLCYSDREVLAQLKIVVQQADDGKQRRGQGRPFLPIDHGVRQRGPDSESTQHVLVQPEVHFEDAEVCCCQAVSKLLG